jgi:2-hydroxy-3-keto-5-methylthiopentenyl-1-phosphate phosphatase
LVIVSDGLEYAIEHVFARAGIAGLPIIANRLLFLGEERLAMVSPYASPTCSSDAGTCKCAQVDKAAPGDFTVLIGDGRSDFCVAQQVDCVLAKGKLLDFCRTNGIPHVAFSDFREISGFLPILEAMAAPDDAEPPFEAFAGYQISPHGMA